MMVGIFKRMIQDKVESKKMKRSIVNVSKISLILFNVYQTPHDIRL